VYGFITPKIATTLTKASNKEKPDLVSQRQ